MAQRKTAPRRTAKKPPPKTGRMPLSMVFWILFFVVLISIFFILLPMVKVGSRTAGISLPTRQTITEQPKVEEPAAQEPAQKPPEEKPRTQPKSQTEKPAEKKPAQKPAEKKPETKPQEKPATQPAKPPTQTPAKQTEPPAQPAKPPERPATKPPETRDRTVYFMRDGGAELTLAKSTRKLAVSDSPLIDCVNALIAGPTADEKNRGMVSYIPPNARLLSARVAGNTVHLNFNEDFRYNTSGREGCEAQLRQIVWTATEFPNVNNVQIEIEGKIVDFLIEGIAIRNPIGR